MRNYFGYVHRKIKKYGNRFDEADMDMRFVAPFCSRQRIRVRFPWGEMRMGTVGVTRGYRPVFRLIVSPHAA